MKSVKSLLFVFVILSVPAAFARQMAPQERQALLFLRQNRPESDAKTLKDGFLMDNIRLAYQAIHEVPWGRSIPKDIFLNDVLPYASLNERRDNWRPDFHQRFIHKAIKAGTIDRAVMGLNKYVFDSLHVSYNIDKRPKPDQSPYESIRAHYASCTG